MDMGNCSKPANSQHHRLTLRRSRDIFQDQTNVPRSLMIGKIQTRICWWPIWFDKDNFIKNLLGNLLLVDIYSRSKKLILDRRWS